MPYKTDKMKLDNEFLDRRVKILRCQKLLIPFLYSSGMSIRSIARRYDVDKRSIQFILFPERHEKNLQDRDLRGGWKQYYNKDYNNEQMKIHRRYKYKRLNRNNNKNKLMKTTIKEAEANKHDLTIIPSGYGHWQISCLYRGKRISTITTNSEAIDNYKSNPGEKKDGCNRIKSGYESLINTIIFKNQNK